MLMFITDQTWVIVSAAIAVGIMLLPYVAGPILVLALIKFKMPPDVLEIDPRAEPLPDACREYFHQSHLKLEEVGFTLVSTMALPSLLPNVRAIFALYRNAETSDLAMSCFMIATTGDEGLKARYVEFMTQYNNDVKVQTNNSKELSSFKRLPGEFTTQFWDVHDIARLYQLHRFLCAKHSQNGVVRNRLDADYRGNAREFIARKVLEETFDAQVGTGYLKRSPPGFRATFKGACLMAWKEAWPIKSLRKLVKEKNAAAIQQEVGSRG